MTPRTAAKAATVVTKKKVAVKAAPKTVGERPAAAGAKSKAAGGAPKVAGLAMKKVSAKRAGVHPHPPVAYRLHALLHTIHSIDHHEDHLCTLLTAIEREGEVSPALGRELAALLEQLPMQAFVADLEAARMALAAGTKRKRA